MNMWLKTDTKVIHLIRIGILVLVDYALQIFVSYYKNMLSSTDTNNMMNVTMHN